MSRADVIHGDMLALPNAGQYQAIYADPPWHFNAWYDGGWRIREDGTRYYEKSSRKAPSYHTMATEDIAALPVPQIAAKNAVLFMWGVWSMLPQALQVIEGWGFKYKTCGFVWMKGNAKQIDMFRDDLTPDMLLGYWTRANTEFCLIGTRGKPKRIYADVRQAILEPRREHSRKPDCIYDRIERLVAGPYLELFARQRRSGWDAWGNEVGKFDAPLFAGAGE